MSKAAIVPREMMRNKPRHGSPCNNCGVCCYAQKCAIGRALFGQSEGPCPALRSIGGARHVCGVIEDPSLYTAHDVNEARRAAMLLLYAGKGCTGRFNGEPTNWSFERELRDFDEDHEAELDAAKRLWGIRPIKLPF